MKNANWSFNQPRPVPLLMTLVACVLFFTLGVWQIQRLYWKEGLIAQLDASLAAPPVELLSIPENELVHKEFTRVTFIGRLHPMTPIYMAARYHNSEVGYHVVLPVDIQVLPPCKNCNYDMPYQPKIVLLNMGWIPADMRGKMHFYTNQTRFTGMIRIAGRKNWFTPTNRPDLNLWFWYDLQQMAGFTHLNLMPVAVDRLDERDASTHPAPPIGFTTASIHLRNDHLQYAIIWFSVGLACLVIFVLYHRKRDDDSGKEA